MAGANRPNNRPAARRSRDTPRHPPAWPRWSCDHRRQPPAVPADVALPSPRRCTSTPCTRPSDDCTSPTTRGLRHYARARFTGRVLQPAVEGTSAQAVGGPTRSVGEFGGLVIEPHADGCERGRQFTNLVADAENVELVHPRRLDEVGRCGLAARQRSRVENGNIEPGAGQVDGERCSGTPGPDDDDVELLSRAGHRQGTSLNVRLAWVGSRSSVRNGTPMP